MKTTLTKNNKLIEVMSIQRLASGYGHNKLTCKFYIDGGKTIEHSIITNNTRLTDRMADDDERIEEEAKLEAIEMVVDDYFTTT